MDTFKDKQNFTFDNFGKPWYSGFVSIYADFLMIAD